MSHIVREANYFERLEDSCMLFEVWEALELPKRQISEHVCESISRGFNRGMQTYLGQHHCLDWSPRFSKKFKTKQKQAQTKRESKLNINIISLYFLATSAKWYHSCFMLLSFCFHACLPHDVELYLQSPFFLMLLLSLYFDITVRQ